MRPVDLIFQIYCAHQNEVWPSEMHQLDSRMMPASWHDFLKIERNQKGGKNSTEPFAVTG